MMFLKTYKSPGQKRPKKRFTPEEMKALATAMVNPDGFTSKDIIANTSYNSPAQANKFLKALEMKGLITLTSQLKKSMEPTRDPDAPETRGRKAKSAEFDAPEDALDMDFGDFEDLDLGDIGALEEEGVLGFDNEAEFMQVLLDYVKRTGKVGELFQMLQAKGMSKEDIMQILNDNGLTLKENNNTMSELEKYVKKVIKEAKNPISSKDERN